MTSSLDLGDGVARQLDRIEQLAEIINDQDFRYSLRKLYAYRKRVLDSVGFGVGDRVVITETWRGVGKDSGWWPYRECMQPGQTGVVGRIEIYPDNCSLHADMRWDDEWSLSTDLHTGTGKRYDSLTDYDGVTPKDRRHVFMFPVKHLRLATAADRPLLMPGRADGIRERALAPA